MIPLLKFKNRSSVVEIGQFIKVSSADAHIVLMVIVDDKRVIPS